MEVLHILDFPTNIKCEICFVILSNPTIIFTPSDEKDFIIQYFFYLPITLFYLSHLNNQWPEDVEILHRQEQGWIVSKKRGGWVLTKCDNVGKIEITYVSLN